ncbi:hypothetical protein MMC14_000681 [Varicellaria rhodocarpa]|nr:hypothetical protein [Varicellaria rhodocarpa]
MASFALSAAEPRHAELKHLDTPFAPQKFASHHNGHHHVVGHGYYRGHPVDSPFRPGSQEGLPITRNYGAPSTRNSGLAVKGAAASIQNSAANHKRAAETHAYAYADLLKRHALASAMASSDPGFLDSLLGIGDLVGSVGKGVSEVEQGPAGIVTAAKGGGGGVGQTPAQAPQDQQEEQQQVPLTPPPPPPAARPKKGHKGRHHHKHGKHGKHHKREAETFLENEILAREAFPDAETYAFPVAYAEAYAFPEAYADTEAYAENEIFAREAFPEAQAQAEAEAYSLPNAYADADAYALPNAKAKADTEEW